MADTFVPPKSTTPRSLRPIEDKEPSKEVLEKTFTMDKSLLSGHPESGTVSIQDASGQTKPAKMVDEETKVAETKKEETKKEEVKKDESKLPSYLKPPTAEKKEEKKDEKKEENIKLIAPPSKEKITRDYSKFSTEEVGHLKQMSDSAYKFVSDLLIQTKNTTKLKEDTIFQHPEAYMLSPEFKKGQEDVTFAKREGDIWQDCLVKIKNGNPFKPITAWDKSGNPIFGEELQPTATLEEQVRIAMNNCYNTAQQAQTKLQQNIVGFQQRYTSDLQTINAERARRFAWIADPKLLDYTLSIDGLGDIPIKQIRQDIVNLFPPYLRNNPGVEVAADLVVALRIQDAELKDLKAQKETAVIKQEELKRGEPTSQTKPPPQSEQAIGGVREFSLDGMPKN